jgi:hypothetical protein
MKYIDVKVRIPVRKMGFFVEDLPEYAQMIGYDKLVEAGAASKKTGRKPIPNGEYTPGKGSAAEAILKVMAKQHMSQIEAINTLKRRFKPRAVGSGFYGLVRRGLLTKQKDGSYAVTH